MQQKERKYTAVIFDLSEVLLTGLKASLPKIYDYVDPLGERPKIFGSELLDQLYLGRISEIEYWQRLETGEDGRQGVKNLPIHVTLLSQLVRAGFSEIYGTRVIIERLRVRGYKLGLTSVNCREWVEYCEQKFRFHHLFDAIQYSYDLGLKKPHPLVFEQMLDNLAVSADQAIYIDDRQQNVDAVTQMGITSICFKDPIQLLQELWKLVDSI